LGLPHERTRAQIKELKASFDHGQLDHVRITLLSQASNRSESEIEGIVDAFRSLRFDDEVDSTMSVRDGTTLYLLVRLFCPRLCVETGAFRGASARIILSDLVRRGEGRLYSIDIDKPSANRYGDLIPYEWRERWELRLQQRKPVLPVLLRELQQIDLFLHDSRHTYRHMRWEYELAWPFLRSGGCLASHDVVNSSAFDDFRREYADKIASSGVIGNLGFIIKR
jgi:predicted O-methyltransferase YrrM